MEDGNTKVILLVDDIPNECVICKKPLGNSKFITINFFDRHGAIKKGPQRCHIARKCTDKLTLTASERAEMDRVIAMELNKE